MLVVCVLDCGATYSFFPSSYPLSNSSRMSLYLSHKNFSKHFSLVNSFFFFKRSFLCLSASFAFCVSTAFMFEKEKCSIGSSRLFFLQCVSTCCFSFRTEFLYSILDYVILKGFKGTRAKRLCSLRFMHCTMEVILH